MTTEIYNAAIGQALQDGYGQLRSPAKVIARLADASERAARNWLSGECGPQAWVLILLMAREPLVEAAVRALVLRQQQLDAALVERRVGRADRRISRAVGR